MSLPSGDTTNHFGDLIDNIYAVHEGNVKNVIGSIYDALTVSGTPRTTGTGSPVDTGTLKANWGVGIIPNSRYIKRQKGVKIPFIPKKIKSYGIHRSYYIWNNTPYLAMANSGTTSQGIGLYGPNIEFVEKAIDKGEKDAGKAGTGTMSARSIAANKILNQPYI